MLFPSWVWGEQSRCSNNRVSLSPQAMRRVQRELKVSKSKEFSGIKLNTHNSGSDLSHLTGIIIGPVNTPYEGGTFELDILVPRDYPFRPPRVRFITNIWHPNVNTCNGEICRLSDLLEAWGPAITIEMFLLCIQFRLSEPEFMIPLNTEATEQYLNDMPAFVSKARYWTEAFAKTESSWMKDKVEKFVEMGFPENLVEGILTKVDYNDDKAMEMLMLAQDKASFWGLQFGKSSVMSLFNCM